MPSAQVEEWVLLAYRLPREPSTPRSTVWRKLKRLGVAQLGDGLVALPADARTREALEWIAEEVVDNHGEAMLWLGRPADAASRAALRERMTAVIAAEYEAVIAEAIASGGDDPATRRRVAARLRRELHRIEARDYFPTKQRATASRAVDDLVARLSDQARK
jgi:ChrB-like protein